MGIDPQQPVYQDMLHDWRCRPKVVEVEEVSASIQLKTDFVRVGHEADGSRFIVKVVDVPDDRWKRRELCR